MKVETELIITDKALRFAAEEGGCRGPCFRVTLDKQKAEDIVKIVNNNRIARDPRIVNQTELITWISKKMKKA